MSTRTSRTRGPYWPIGALALCAWSSLAHGQTYTDAITREVTVLIASSTAASDAITREVTVLIASSTAASDAITREITLQMDTGDGDVLDSISREVTLLLDPEGDFPTDTITREATVFRGVSFVTVTSTDPALALPVFGTLSQQLAALNAAPPPFEPNVWLPVHRKNDNTDDTFLCTAVPDPLTRGYVSADQYIDAFGIAADEVTLDNCGSAFYRFMFTLPDDAVLSTATLTGSANVDDQGIVWLNSTRLSALMAAPSCSPGNPSDPLDPCYLQQDAGEDRVDSTGRRVLTWPTLDPIETQQGGAFVAGENVLIFAVAGDAQALEPTGVEFAAAVLYAKRGDVNCDGQVDFFDIDPFVIALGGASGYGSTYPYCRWLTADADCDGDVDFFDIDAFVACLGGDCACP